MFLPVRDALVGLIHPEFLAQFPDLPIVYDNQPFDRNDQPEKNVEVSIVFDDSSQVFLGSDPLTRVQGTVEVLYICRAGLGSREALAVLDWFSQLLKYRVVGRLQLRHPKVSPGDSVPGWYSPSLAVGFHVDV